MEQKMQRPDTPLAPTPEPQPVTSGLKPMTKYQATADAAIEQINNLPKGNMPKPALPNQQQ